MTRRADLAKTHIGAAELGWRTKLDDDEYRCQLFAVCRVRSAADLDEPGRRRFIAHMRQCGWKPKASASMKKKAKAPGQASDEQLHLVRHLWSCLVRAGQVNHGDEAALRRWVRAQTKGKFDAIEFLDSATAVRLIERLKKWSARCEIDCEHVG